MRALLLFCLYFVLIIHVSAQPVTPTTTTVPDSKFGAGGTKTTTVTDNGLGIKVTTEEYTDGQHPPHVVYKTEKTENLIEKETTTKTTSYTTFDKPPKLDNTIEVRTNPQGDTIYREDTHYLDGKVMDGSTRRVRLPDGTWEHYRYNGKTREFELKKQIPVRVKENGRTGYLAGNCKNEAFIGFSYLYIKQDENHESFPIGGHAAYTYLFVKQFGLVADASIHTKKENDFRITRAFLMGGLQYNLLKAQEQRVILPLLRLLAGIAMDKQKYSFGDISNTDKATAFAIAFGLGLNCKLNQRLALALLADYINTRFGEESQSNIKASLGIRFNLGCK